MGCLAQHVVLREVRRIGQAELFVKDVQGTGREVGIGRVHKAGIVAHIGYGDGLAGTVADGAVTKNHVADAVVPAIWAGA